MEKNELQRLRIGQRIAQLRKEKGLTQRALAELSGMHAPHIARIERGTYSVGFDTLEALAEAMDMTVDIVPVRAVINGADNFEDLTLRLQPGEIGYIIKL